jgi:hypothetical protein
LEHDSPTLLFRLGCEYLISARVIRPGPVTVVARVAQGVPVRFPRASRESSLSATASRPLRMPVSARRRSAAN